MLAAESFIIWDDDTQEFRPAQIVGELDMEIGPLREIVQYILESALDPDEAIHPELTPLAARNFDQALQRLDSTTTTTDSDKKAIQWYFTLPFTRQWMIYLVERNIPPPFTIFTRPKQK